MVKMDVRDEGRARALSSPSNDLVWDFWSPGSWKLSAIPATNLGKLREHTLESWAFADSSVKRR